MAGRDWRKFADEAVATLPAAADTIAVVAASFVAYTDLAQLNPGAVARRQIADERPKIDPMICCEIERDLVPVVLAVDIDHLHRQPMLADEPEDLFLAV